MINRRGKCVKREVPASSCTQMPPASEREAKHIAPASITEAGALRMHFYSAAGTLVNPGVGAEVGAGVVAGSSTGVMKEVIT